VTGGRFVEAPPGGLDFPGDEHPRDRLGPAEEGEHEEADGEAAAGGALCEERKGQQCRCDAWKRPPVLQCTRHVRASFYPANSTAVFPEGEKSRADRGKNCGRH